MSYMIIIYLLLSMGVGTTTQEQSRYGTSYLQNGTIEDAHLVQDDPRFPSDYGQNRQRVNAIDQY
jgi:hypothetical protein